MGRRRRIAAFQKADHPPCSSAASRQIAPNDIRSPHGAGRQFSRSAARKTFTQEKLREAMVGIEYRD
ncbi:hypothetical protein DN468_31745, partial [Burkholderia multivorans]